MRTRQEIEAEITRLVHEKSDMEQRERRRQYLRGVAWEDEHGISVGLSDDYAVLDVDGLRFYYGYEHQVCPLHGEDECECDEREWTFLARKGRDVLMQIPESKMNPDVGKFDVVRGLLNGIGLWLKARGDK